MNKTCPKCNYKRNGTDDELVPDYQCPNCDIVYAKYKSPDQLKIESLERQLKEAEKNGSASDKANNFLRKTAALVGEEIEIALARKPKANKIQPNRKPPSAKKLKMANMEMEQHKTNHILHLLLSVFTAGIWLIFWLIVTANNTNERNKIRDKYYIQREPNKTIYFAYATLVMFVLGAFAFFGH